MYVDAELLAPRGSYCCTRRKGAWFALSSDASIHIAHNRALGVENSSPVTILYAHLVAFC